MSLPRVFAFSICRALLLQVPVVNSDLQMIGLLFSLSFLDAFDVVHRFADLIYHPMIIL